jgi:tetratricopeptide (TPR) repeat protein
MMNAPAAPRSTRSRRTVLFLAVALAIFAVAAGGRLAAEAPLNVERSAPADGAVDAGASAAGLDAVAAAQARIEQRPEDAGAYAQLGLALLQKVRESNDTTLYAGAERAFAAALARDPQQLDALVGRGMLALALHDFRGALAIGNKIQALNPYKAAALGVRVDALVELGRYAEAVAALQQMVDLRPDLESYSRVSYLRELHGDVSGAIEAMRMAADTAVPASEPWLWTTTHLGHLLWAKGDLAGAEEIYRAVLVQDPAYPAAQYGLARLAAARGERLTAIAILRPLAARLPLPEYLTALGDLYAGQGDTKAAEQQYDLVRVTQQLNAAAGMNVDLELAAFDVLHNPDHGAALASAQEAYAQRPTIYAAAALSLALHKNGDDEAAWKYMQEALRLGTQDAALHAQAAEIAQSRGDTAAAEVHQKEVQRINPHYSPWR